MRVMAAEYTEPRDGDLWISRSAARAAAHLWPLPVLTRFFEHPYNPASRIPIKSLPKASSEIFGGEPRERSSRVAGSRQQGSSAQAHRLRVVGFRRPGFCLLTPQEITSRA